MFSWLEVLEGVLRHYGEPGSVAQLLQVSIQRDPPEHRLHDRDWRDFPKHQLTEIGEIFLNIDCMAEIGCDLAKSDKPDVRRPRKQPRKTTISCVAFH